MKDANMKHIVLCAVVVLAAASHGGWLDSALKSVDNATQKASDVNNALQGSAAQPAPAPAAQPAPAPAAQQPLSYQEKVKAVNDGLQVASAKMPLRDHYQEMYNAAYEFSNIDRQFSFLPPEQRATRTSPEKMKLVDEFLAWIEGGAVIAQGAAQPPSGAPAVPSGYGQAPSCANAPSTRGGNAENGSDQHYSMEEALPKFQELCSLLSDAGEKGYKVKAPSYMDSIFAFSALPKTRIDTQCKPEIEALIATAKTEYEKNQAEAAKARQEKLDELNKALADIDSAIEKYNADVETGKKIVADYFDKYSEYFYNEDYMRNLECNGETTSQIESYNAKKRSGDFNNTDSGEGLDYALRSAKQVLQALQGGGNPENGKMRERKADAEEQSPVSVAVNVTSPAVKKAVEERISEIDKHVVDKLVSYSGVISAKLQQALESEKISLESANKMREERNSLELSSSSLKTSARLEKALSLLKKIDDEIENNQKAAQEKETLVKKLAGLDVSAWIAELEGRPQGEDFDKLVNAALKAKFGLEAPAKAQLGGVRKLVSKFYTKEQQLKIVKTEGIGPLGVFLAIISVADDAEFRKTLLVDNTDWAFLCLRRDFDSDDLDSEIGQYAYVTLLAQEKNLDVLVAIYEKQDRWNFKYTPNAPKSDGTPGAELEKMMKQYKDFNGDGYGRLGEWMLDSCGKEFGKRVSKLADARRKVAKDQMFMMKDFYLGMPHRDARLVMRGWDKKKNGNVWMSFGSFNNGTLSEINFNGKARTEYLGVKKDGLKGIGQFVEKYIPGGLNSVDDLKVGGETDVGHDPANPQVTVTTWWYTNCHKYDCRIRAYDSGTICILNTSSDDYPKLDFSKVKE